MLLQDKVMTEKASPIPSSAPETIPHSPYFDIKSVMIIPLLFNNFLSLGFFQFFDKFTSSEFLNQK